MARIKFTNFVPRDKPKKRPGRHKKNLNRSLIYSQVQSSRK